jgi:hypothetical protein
MCVCLVTCIVIILLIQAKLREAGVEPTEHPNVQAKEDLIRLYVQVCAPIYSTSIILLTLQRIYCCGCYCAAV